MADRWHLLLWQIDYLLQSCLVNVPPVLSGPALSCKPLGSVVPGKSAYFQYFSEEQNSGQQDLTLPFSLLTLHLGKSELVSKPASDLVSDWSIAGHVTSAPRSYWSIDSAGVYLGKIRDSGL